MPTNVQKEAQQIFLIANNGNPFGKISFRASELCRFLVVQIRRRM